MPDLKYTGYACHGRDKWNALEKIEFDPKPFAGDDIEIKVDFCGVCGSDIHTLTAGWDLRPTSYPIVVGHEIVGKAVRVGPKVKDVKVGDVVGVGANAWSCGECRFCVSGDEHFCPALVETYNSTYPDGTRAFGGYANFVRIQEQFVYPIPDGLAPEAAAPMLCGGLTVYSPLVTERAGPGKRVGIIGIGGLGHMAVLFAVALGAEVTAISRGTKKKDDALKLGAIHYIDTSVEGWDEPHQRTFDILLSTSNAKDQPLEQFLGLLDVRGTMVYVGIPECKLPPLQPEIMVASNTGLRGSNTGNKKEAMAMLELAASKNVAPWIEKLPMSQCNKALDGLSIGKARYRYVLEADF